MATGPMAPVASVSVVDGCGKRRIGCQKTSAKESALVVEVPESSLESVPKASVPKRDETASFGFHVNVAPVAVSAAVAAASVICESLSDLRSATSEREMPRE